MILVKIDYENNCVKLTRLNVGLQWCKNMNTYNNPLVTREKIIEILLFQYESLRQEELNAMSSSLNLATIMLGTLVAVLGLIQQTRATEIFLFIPPGLTVFFLLYLNQQWVVFYIGRYLKVIEKLVNEIAGIDILLWETLFAGSMIQGKILLEHRSKLNRAINYYPLTTSVILIILGISYGFSVIVSGTTILAANPTTPYLAVASEQSDES